VSWQRSGSAALRTVFDGWGFTAFGLITLFCGWGIWAASGGNAGSVPAYVGFVLAVAVGAGVFALLRLGSRLVVERLLGRVRMHARWAHFLTGLFLTVAGFAYAARAPLWVQSVAWLRDAWTRR
jgi:hypothetical protein